MAVEAGSSNIFSQQLIQNNSNQATNAYIYNNQMGLGASYNSTTPETMLPFHQSSTPVKTDSGLTYNYNYNLSSQRKRPRDSTNNLNDFSSFLGETLSLDPQQQQMDIDHIITQHTKKMRMAIEEREKQRARLLLSAVSEGVVKKLNEKEEQIRRMGKLNFALQEKVKGLCVENQLWRDLAQTNEAAVLSLRSNLEQVLAHVSEERISGGGAAVADDAESCCGSSGEGEMGERRRLAEEEERKLAACRSCGERESCVLLLPCRHLCLCAQCGSTLQSCPVCNSSMNATVHVNMS